MLSVALVIIWIGLPLLSASLAALRTVSMWQRQLAGRLLDLPVERPYLPAGTRGVMEDLRIRLTDSATYRDAAWLVVTAKLGLTLGIVSTVFFLVFPLGALAPPVMMRTYFTVATYALRRSNTDAMAQRIGELSSSRAETVDSRLRRSDGSNGICMTAPRPGWWRRA